MARSFPGEFRNVILCQDIRDEIGNKKSLMGVFSGDVLVAEFPARLKFCFYMEFITNVAEKELQLELVLTQEGHELLRVQASVDPKLSVTTLIIPQGIAILSAAGDFVVTASAGGEKREIMRKKVYLSPSPLLG